MPRTLLLADDSVTIQKVVGISFANEDIILVTVSNGTDAIAKARELKPDIVLADVVMPGKNGYEVCEALKSDPALRHIPVLLLTGTFEAFDEERARSVGADGHITKPFEAQALVDTVNARLDVPRAAPAKTAEPPRAASAPAAADEPFDFLEEEPTAPSALSADAGRTTLLMGSEVSLAASDDAFGFDGPEVADDAFQLDEEPFGRVTALQFDDGDDGDRTQFSAPSASSDTSRPLAGPGGNDVTRVLAGAAAAKGAVASFDDSALDDMFGDELAAAAPPVAPRIIAFDAPSAEFEHDDLVDAFEDEPPLARQEHEPIAAFAQLDEDPYADTLAQAIPLGMAAGATPDLSPLLRQQLHETLEKMAWEAFGDVAERIVREALARVEEVAWEVIPRMAEAMIQEEIRKLKGEE